ncbi:MAG: hypothetical protein ACE37I_19600 [Rubinisphaera brasiliensis]|uniref:DUF883 domain-containing protein n=1 Tax=Rubinisphaera brasiliensis (strain ATCC 49424 / DSM 5305 / JCM 21570 / IAM 15109 / NBRC 103401 / IFAM 1448) TaxID=756272 RepID=F0SKM6_RUBBR|nr:hypothetical protein [Rubinisphaera brasiliensis]ADY58696.1 hypothetical protein Plabr_1078 [Rubinisphaera brasiliensis DSM 5305]MBR9801955.1 hypothetical protein [bacterium]
MNSSDTINRLRSQVEGLDYDQVMKDSSERLASYVDEYPISTVVTALSAGIVIGAAATMLMLPRSRRRYR